MDSLLLLIFHHELAFQCRAVLLNYERVQEFTAEIRKWPKDLTLEDFHRARTRLWVALQGVIVAAGNLSKLLWGGQTNKRAMEDRASLRASLAVDDSSPLNNVDLRNDFEHFDERLERWYKSPRKGLPMYYGRNIGRHDFYDYPDDPRARFHHYDPDKEVVEFWDHSMNIGDVVRATEAIIPLLTLTDSRKT